MNDFAPLRVDGDYHLVVLALRRQTYEAADEFVCGLRIHFPAKDYVLFGHLVPPKSPIPPSRGG